MIVTGFFPFLLPGSVGLRFETLEFGSYTGSFYLLMLIIR